MAQPRFELGKFNGKSNFNLWRIKIRALLVHQGFKQVLNGDAKLPENLSENEKREVLRKAHSAIILTLSDGVLTKILKEKIALDLLEKL